MADDMTDAPTTMPVESNENEDDAISMDVGQHFWFNVIFLTSYVAYIV